MKKSCSPAISLLIVAALFIQLTLSTRTLAQTPPTGSLFFTVVDDQGDPLPGVTVTLSDRGGSRTDVSNAQGQGRFRDLPAGTYSLKAELDGFATVEFPDVPIQVGKEITVNVDMSAAVEDVITVTAESPLLDERKLRDAITRANNDPGHNTIDFSFPGSVSNNVTINLTTQLPEITDPLTIYNSSDNPNVELNGRNLPPDTDCFKVSANLCYFKGLKISGFRNGITFVGPGGGSTITDCFIDSNRIDGVCMNGVHDIDVFNSTISRNGVGINISNVSLGVTRIQNNNIGTDQTGRTINPDGIPNNGDETGNGEGIRIVNNSSDIRIGGTEPGEGNVVGGNADGMSAINSSRITIQANYFGTNALRDNLRNPGAGIGLAGNTNNVIIGGSALQAINTIANNGFGIIAFAGTFQNLFLFNQFIDNTGLPIDLNFPNGASPNDNGDGDGGANGTQNFAVVTSADASATNTIIRATLNSTPNITFTLQYYIDGGGAKLPIGSRNVTTDGNGNANADVTIPTPLQGGRLITTLATNTNTGDTSEFSPSVPITGTGQPDLEVTKTGPATINCGDQVTYSITARNVGTAASVSVGVIDQLPQCLFAFPIDEVQVTTSQGHVNEVRFLSAINVELGLVAPGATVTITIKTTFLRDCEGSIKNEVTVFADGDTNKANDKASVQTTVVDPCAKITGIFVESGTKNVIVEGSGFKKGDIIEINGRERKTKFIDANTLRVKKGKGSLLECDPDIPGQKNKITLIRPGNIAQPIIDTAAFATCP